LRQQYDADKRRRAATPATPSHRPPQLPDHGEPPRAATGSAADR
jgi:hypothetical protein